MSKSLPSQSLPVPDTDRYAYPECECSVVKRAELVVVGYTFRGEGRGGVVAEEERRGGDRRRGEVVGSCGCGLGLMTLL